MSGDNLTGNFTSQIFDATGDATWNNLTWTGSKPNIMFKYAVDGAGDIFSSIDLTTWTQQVDNYGRTSDTQEMFSYGDYLYIISSSNREVWRSSTGSSWSVINDTFADSGLLVAEAHSNGDLFIGDASGDVYLSTDYGQTWTTKGDFNGGSTSNAKGMGISSTGEIFIIDGGKALFSSTDSADTWSEITNDYTGSGASLDDLEIDSSGNLYILDAKDVWKSSNSGVSWTIINDSFTPYSNEGLKMFIDSDDNFRITDAAGRVFSSTDSGVTWIEYGDFNGGASSNSKGFALFAQQTNISYQFMNCSTSDCSDGTWQTGDLENINLQSRYFRYVASFSTPDSSSGPIIQTVTTNYDLSNSAPTIDLTSPTATTYDYNTSLPLNFTVTDADSNLDACWYNLNGGANTTLTSCANTTFSIIDGAHTLNLFANDTLGSESSSSVNFNVDSTGVTSTLIEPTGTKTSRTTIPFNYTVQGNSLTCWYNVKTSIGGDVIDNTTLASCANTTFDVSSDGDYIANLFVNNTFGTSNTTSTTFTVSTSDTSGGDSGSSGGGGGSSGGGSSGGGGGSGSYNQPQFEIGPVSAIISIGEEKNLQVSVKNTKLTSANNCKLTVSQEYSDYVGAEEIQSIAGGGIFDFSFILNAIDEQVQNVGLSIGCLDEITQEIPLEIVLLSPELDISFEKISFDSEEELLIEYSVESLFNVQKDLVFKLTNSNGDVVKEVTKSVDLVSGEIVQGSILIELSDVEKGMVKVSISEENSEPIVEESIIYGGAGIGTGFTLFNSGENISPTGIVILVFLVLLFFVLRRIWKLRKGAKPAKKKKK